MKHSDISLLVAFVTLQFGLRVGAGAPCHLDDIQKTIGECRPIKECNFALGQLYAGATKAVKRCPGGTQNHPTVCCPTKFTLAEKKCQEYKEILKSPKTFGQPGYREPHCAYQGSAQFIVGGRNAHEFEFPYAVGLGYGDNPENLFYACGATLISNKYLLTAAHCIQTERGRPRWAVIGDVTLNQQTSVYRKRVRIADWIVHPEYKPPQIYNDIALLKLSETLELSRYLLPACLGGPITTPRSDGNIQAIGWGQLGFGEVQASHLQAVNLTLIPVTKCKQHYSPKQAEYGYRYPDGVKKSQMCAGDVSETNGEIGKDTCNGDSGGGVVVNPQYKCLFHVVGVTSVGSKLCGYGEPGIYTKVVSYIDWIEKIVWT